MQSEIEKLYSVRPSKGTRRKKPRKYQAVSECSQKVMRYVERFISSQKQRSP